MKITKIKQFTLIATAILSGCAASNSVTTNNQSIAKTTDREIKEQTVSNGSSNNTADLLVAEQNTAQETNQTNVETPATEIKSFANLPPIPLDKNQATEFLDIRGVGDSAMALTYQQPPKPDQPLPEGGLANFGERLDAFDPTGKSYRGDLSFINWESAIGQYCNQFRGTPSPSSYTFVSHPINIAEAYRRGFNMIGLANNHSWDCPVGEQGLYGAKVSALYMENLTEQMTANWLWHGVGDDTQKTTAQVNTITVKGKPIKIAFASLYLGAACTNITCIENEDEILQSLKDADADIRIISIHSWNKETQQNLVSTGTKFIRDYKGDIVFGHGPHVWQPVTIIESNSGKKGVMFESLGNFIHPNLAAKRKDMIGRVLLDLDTLTIQQVQGIPLRVDASNASFQGALSAQSIPAKNFTWQSINQPSWGSEISPQVQGVYYNLEQE